MAQITPKAPPLTMSRFAANPVDDAASSDSPWGNYRGSRHGNKGSFFPVFEWDATERENRGAYNHSSVRLPYGEGLVVDTGAVEDLTGLDFIRRQSIAAEQYGHSTAWESLANPKRLSGVGDSTKTCTHQAKVVGALETGELVQYTAPVIPGEPSPVPPLYGLNSMSAENTYFSARSGTMHLVPHGRESEISWPEGTRTRQCVKAPSGHWLLAVSHWDRVGRHAAALQDSPSKL